METKDTFAITADAPGFTPDDIQVEMNDGTLTIRGKRQEEKVDEKEGKVRQQQCQQSTELGTLLVIFCCVYSGPLSMLH